MDSLAKILSITVFGVILLPVMGLMIAKLDDLRSIKMRVAKKPSAPIANNWDRYDQLVAERKCLDKRRAELNREIADLEKKLEGNGPKSVYRLRGKVTG